MTEVERLRTRCNVLENLLSTLVKDSQGGFRTISILGPTEAFWRTWCQEVKAVLETP